MRIRTAGVRRTCTADHKVLLLGLALSSDRTSTAVGQYAIISFYHSQLSGDFPAGNPTFDPLPDRTKPIFSDTTPFRIGTRTFRGRCGLRGAHQLRYVKQHVRLRHVTRRRRRRRRCPKARFTR